MPEAQLAMSGKKSLFQVGILGSLLAVVFFSVFTGLSWWQYQRSQEKITLQAEYERLQTLPPVQINAMQTGLSFKRFVKVKVRGKFLPEADILLDNVIVNGRAGYHVITPLRISDTGHLMMVNRGWVPAGKSREILPHIETPLTEVEISGRIDRPRSKPVGLSDDIAPDSEGRGVWLYLDIPYYMKKTGDQVVQNSIILLDGDSGHGYARDWPGYDAKVGMHIGYTIHWAAFALATLAIYLWFGFRSKDEDE